VRKLLFIVGPTATGKTGLGAFLAQKFSGEIISADSRQVFKGMDIVTGKDRPAGVRLHGYDLVKPDEDFSVAHFVAFAQPAIEKIWRRGNLPLVVGGTGFWVKALTEPIDTIAVPADHHLRKKLEAFSAPKLLKLLKQLNPQKAASLNASDRLNPRRLIRAVEVATHLQGLSLKVEKPLAADTLLIGLTASLPVLDARVEKRVGQRLKSGALQEWSRLKKKYRQDLPSMSAIGYRQLPDVNRWITAERQYLRRQLTWFKKVKEIAWFDVSSKNFRAKVETRVKAWYT